jgi:hypothetical protein
MSRKRISKLLHLASTAWLVLCVGYILVLALRQAGFQWWVIFSLSGHSVLLIFLLISLYLFAIFRGTGKSQKIEIEHLLTSTEYYIVFYIIAPFLGGLTGIVGMIGENRISHFLLGIALGTLGATFLVWVIVDPVTGLLETLLVPASRKHRTERMVQIKVRRQNEQKDRERLLAEVLAKEELIQRYWQEELRPHAEKLAELLAAADEINFRKAERQAVNIGVDAWQKGGLRCMQELRDMTMELCERNHKDMKFVDYVSGWWDGIGSWRNPSIC